MKAAENNVWQKAGEDPDFLAALVWADTWRFLLHGEAHETTMLPTWVLLHSVQSWHVEDKTLVVVLGGENNDRHGTAGGNPADEKNVHHTGGGG